MNQSTVSTSIRTHYSNVDRVPWRKASVLTRLDALYIPALITVTLGAFALRLVLWDRFPFREDEAAYAFWALHGWFDDPMFLTVWPDKPPLFLWLLGGAFRLFGVSEASARWINIAAGTLTVPVVAATANRLWDRRSALIAASLLALSPYAISFGPTAYTDPLLVLLGMLAFCLALFGRSFWAGLILGAAVMTKQQGLLYTPLVVSGLWIFVANAESDTRHLLRRIAQLAAGAVVILLPILLWDSARWAVAPSPWDLGARNYTALTLLSPADWSARITLWRPLLYDLTASWGVWLLLGVMFIAGTAVNTTMLKRRTRQVADRGGALPALLIAGWSLAYLAAHIITSMHVWDRYLLPLAPMLALLAGWAYSRIATRLPSRVMLPIAAVLLLTLLSPARMAANGRLALGGDHGDYAGLPTAIDYVRNSGSGSAVLYHRELGAHLRFYLSQHGKTSERTHRIEQRWFPSEVYLADNAAQTPYTPKYLIQPDWAPMPNLAPHLAMRQLTLTKLTRHGRFTVWEIAHQPKPTCDWCLCGKQINWPPDSHTTTDSTTPGRTCASK